MSPESFLWFFSGTLILAVFLTIIVVAVKAPVR